VFITSKRCAEIELGGDESKCFKKPLIMAFLIGILQGFSRINYDESMNWLISPLSVGIVDFPAYLLGTILIILLPGPNSLYVLSISSLKGWRAGAWASLGIFIGDTVLMIGVVLGAASLLNSSTPLFNFIRILGAIYLAWMGYGLIQDGFRRWRVVRRTTTGGYKAHYLNTLHPTIAALALSLTNPKAIFFFVSFFTQFIQPDYAQPLHTFLYLAVVLQIISMAYLASLIFVGQFFSSYFQQHSRYAAVLLIVVGILLFGFAGKLLL
jgi:leucine efflux protein